MFLKKQLVLTLTLTNRILWKTFRVKKHVLHLKYTAYPTGKIETKFFGMVILLRQN